MESTIITLQPTTDQGQVRVIQSADFEEAFGDFSELRGKGRARRQKRKLEKTANKVERKTAKIEGKQAVKKARKSGRQLARIERRGARKDARQDVRTGQQERRLERRDNRLAQRQERNEATQTRRDTRKMGKLGRRDAETLSEQDRMNYEAESEDYRNSLAPEESVDDSQDSSGGSQEEDMGYNTPSDQQYSEESMPSDSEYDTPESNSDSGEYYPEDDAYSTDEAEYSQEENEFYDDNSSFNAESMDGKVVVSPAVKDTVNKINWNCRLIKTELAPKRDDFARKGLPTVGIQKAIDDRVARVEELKSSLDAYASADGTPAQKSFRRKEVAIATRKRNMPPKRHRRPIHGGSETPVDSDLNPDFKRNRIVVPADSKSSFDDIDDFDYDTQTENGRPIIFQDSNIENQANYRTDDEPTARIYELKSNASGTESKVNWKNVLIGVGIGVALFYVAKKTKIIK